MDCTVPPSSLFSSWIVKVPRLTHSDRLVPITGTSALSPASHPSCLLVDGGSEYHSMFMLVQERELGFSLLAVDAQDRMHPVMKGNHAQCSSK